MSIVFSEATKDDIPERIRLRIAYMVDDYGRERGLGRVDLSATKEGYPIYAKLGFQDKEHRYTDMRYRYEE